MKQDNQELNQHIEEYLDYYFSLSHSPGFAILLKGEWGSGKTWFIDKYRAKPEYKKKKILYVSLYGMTSFAEIENAFFQQLYPIRSSKAFAVTEQFVRGLIRTTFHIDLNRDGKDETVSLQIPQIDLPKSLEDIEEIILIFDDLERCQIDISNVLGYINSFVEHKKSKVIILANEGEILKQNSECAQAKYLSMKEKLIYKTFRISPDLNNALISFAERINELDLKNFLLNNVDLIQELYTTAKYYNLRVLQHIIFDVERLYAHLPEKAKNKSEFLREILQILIAFSIEIKRGSISAKDIQKLDKEDVNEFSERSINLALSSTKNNQPIQQSNQIEDKSKNNLRKILDSYSYLDISRPFPSLEWWQKFFDRGEIDQQELESSLVSHKSFQDENTPNWIRLWHFSDLNDDELDPLIEKVESEYASRQFQTIGEVKHITGIFLKLSDVELYKRDKQDILQQAKLYVDWLRNNDYIDIYLQQPATLSFEYKFNGNNGLAFQAKDSNEFKELCAYIDEVRESIKLKTMPQLAEKLLSIMQNDQFEFYQMICWHMTITTDSKIEYEWDHIYYKVPIFKYINPEQFVEKLLKIPHQDWNLIFSGLKNRYKFNNINEKLIEEFAWFKSIYKLLLLEADRRKNKISGYNLKSYTEGCLNEALENILESLKQQITKILKYLLSNPIRFTSFSQYILSDLLIVFKDWYLDITNSP